MYSLMNPRLTRKARKLKRRADSLIIALWLLGALLATTMLFRT
jgi:hypothetical protein